MRRTAVVVVAGALALGSCSTPPDSADTVGPAEGSETSSTAPGSAAGIELRPVLAGPQPCETFDATATTFPIEPAVAGCVEVGPAAVDGTDLARAEATPGGATGIEWVVEVEVAEAARAAADVVFDACSAHDPTCPTALLAIVVDGRVVSAPSVASAGLADHPFVISGGGPEGFTQDEAEALAGRIGS